MSTIVKAKDWQRNRALEVHREFVSLAAEIQTEGTPLMKGLEALSKRLDGRPISAGILKNRRVLKSLRCGVDNLYRMWRRWNDGGCTSDALLLNYRYVAPEKGSKKPVPAALAAEIQRRCTLKTGGRDKGGLSPISVVYKWLCDDFRDGNPIPGINYDDYPQTSQGRILAEFPWSYRTVVRYAPPDHERALGNRGVAAFRAKACHVTREYSKLRKCELYTLDDVRLDLICIDEATGAAVTVKCYIMMEVASRYIVGFFLKPDKAIHQENVSELVAHCLQVPGFGIGVGYITYILFERGTVACSDAAKNLLEAATHDRIKIIRTSMDGGVTWVGSPRDRASGHAAGKGVIESFMRRLHFSLMRLPGQIGNNHDNAPASVGQLGKPGFFEKGSRREFGGTFVDECERLAQFAVEVRKRTGKRLTIQLPGLWLMELQQLVKEAIDKHNHEAGHEYQGHGEFAEAEIEPGVWQELNGAALVTAPNEINTQGNRSSREVATEPSEPAAGHAGPLPAAGDGNGKVYVLTAPVEPLTIKQRNGIYFRLWKAATAAQPRLDRFAITRRVLGCVPKIKDMTDEQFTKVVHVFESIAKKGAK